MNDSYPALTAAMVRTGVLGFGGGPSTVPLFRHEAVTRYQWMTNEEFAEVLAIANALPGPIATKLAAYMGFRLRGTAGAALGVIAHILPTCAAMVILYSFISFFQSSPVVSGMIAAAVPVVAVMLGQMAYEFGEKAAKGLGLYAAIVWGIIALLLLAVIQVHPAAVIVLFLLYGSVHHKVMDKWRARKRPAEGGSDS
ncbi:chromate transporter [Paenibacillus sp. CC-CFT747]|nr:chromate transporter [Paenibacillus sp. CC-CFT747]